MATAMAHAAELCTAWRCLYPAGMTMQELMKEGRKGVQEIDGTLNRAEKVVEDTLQIGQQVRSTIAQLCLQDRHEGTAVHAMATCQAMATGWLRKVLHAASSWSVLQQLRQLHMAASC
jgi:hypothetical protein